MAPKPAAKESPARVSVSEEFKLRRAAGDDRGALCAFYRDFEPKGASLGLPPRKEPERWLEALSGYRNFLLVSEGRIVAHAVLCPQGSSGEVAVFVGQDYRGRGLGKRLLMELILEARRRGLRRVWGMTELDNLPMLRLAHALGFVPGQDPYEFTLDLEKQPQAARLDSLAA